MFDRDLMNLVGGVLVLLVVSTLIGWGLGRRNLEEPARRTINNLRARIRAWWLMTLLFVAAIVAGSTALLTLFGLISFLALREFITLTPTRSGDHRALFWAFFIVTPLQYVLLAVEFQAMFMICIPVYVFLFLPIRSAAAGDTEHFLARTATIQWGLMVCVYCISHAPALMTLLPVHGFDTRSGKLLAFFVIICELSDVLQYVFGKMLGRHPVAPQVSPGKTWEGLIGGVAATTAIGAGLWWATPFSPLVAAEMSLGIALMGFGGGLVMSAIKRDRGVKDWGRTISGHGGILDRFDSLCFAAPVFYHLTRYYYGA